MVAGRLKASECLSLCPQERLSQALFQGVKMGAGDVLVPPSGSHFKVVMPEVRDHLKALAEISRDFVFHLVLP